VRKDVQRLLADIRTDLDSFCDAEAHALMTSGYKMTTHNLKERGFGASRQKQDWEFEYIDRAMQTGHQRLMDILAQSGGLAFKIWKLSRSLRVASLVLLVLAFAVAAYAAWKTQDVPLITVGGLLTTILIFVLTAVLGPVVGHILGAPGWLKRAAIGVGTAVAGWAIVGVHLTWFDRWYLKYGNRSTSIPIAGWWRRSRRHGRPRIDSQLSRSNSASDRRESPFGARREFRAS